MTTPHQIGELLRTGVRPTDEEIEHLTSLGGFAAEMLARYLDGQKSMDLAGASDAWSERLSSRLAASTAERWRHGLGLADMLLDSGIGGWWDVSRDGFATGYEGLDPEMEVLALFDEEVPGQAVPEEGRPAPRRRRSLFGAKQATSARRPVSPRLKREMHRPSRIAQGANVDGAGAQRSQPARAGRWLDGALAELTVLRALAAGGLPVADQIAQVLEAAAPAAGADAVSTPWAPAAARPLREVTPSGSNWTSASGSGAVTPRVVSLDGLRIDARTPALASALERVEAVFGAGGPRSPALNARRIEAMTSAVKVSIDRGLGAGERPVFGFYDAVESTFISLGAEAVEATVGGQPIQSAAGPRARIQDARTQREYAVSSGRKSGASAAIGRRALTTTNGPIAEVSLDRLVPDTARGTGLRPFTAGVFPPAQTAKTRSPGGRGAGFVRAGTAAPKDEGTRNHIQVAAELRYTPSGEQVPAVQRSAMGAPRIAIHTMRVGSPAGMLAPERLMVGGLVPEGTRFLGRVGLPGGVAGRSGGVDSRMAGTALDIQGLPRVGARTSLVVNEEGVEAGVPSSRLGAPSVWRLAADGGPDMPLGAAFSKAELFGATHTIAQEVDVRGARGDFRALIAQPREEKAARANRLAGAVDGLVWVTTPVEPGPESTTQTAVAAGVDRLPMAAVPRGRSATMIPAGSALAAITQAAMAERALTERSGGVSSMFGARRSGAGLLPASLAEVARGEGSVAAGSRAADATGREQRSAVEAAEAIGLAPTSSGTTRAPVSGVEAGGGAATLGRLLRSGILTTRGFASASMFGGGESSTAASASNWSTAGSASDAGLRMRGATSVGGAEGGVTPIGMRVAPDLISRITAMGGPGGGAAMRAIGGRAASGDGAMLGSVSLGARWIDSALSGGASFFELSRAISNAIASGYQRLDHERVMLAVSGELNSGSQQDIARAEEARRSVGGVVLPVARVATGGVSAAVEVAPFAAAQAGAGARQALLRPVMTAREARAVAQAFAPARSVPQRASFVSGASSIAQEAAKLGASATGANEPVLSRLIADAKSPSRAAGLASRWDVDGGMLERIAALGMGARAQLARSLADAGWAASELQMLALSAPTAGPDMQAAVGRQVVVDRAGGALEQRPSSAGAMVGAEDARMQVAAGRSGEPSVGRGDSAGVSESGAWTSAAAAPAEARVGRMGQNLARVLGGAEALGASVSGEGDGLAGRAAARMQASAWLPLLGATHSDKYFGGLAPSTTSRASTLSLQDAVGELVKLAEVAAAQSDTPVSVEARREVLRRVDAVRARVSARGGAERVQSGVVLATRRTEQQDLVGTSVARSADARGAEDLGSPSLLERVGRGTIGSGVDAELVARATARGVIDTTPGLASEPSAREMRIAEAERTVLSMGADERSEATAVPGGLSAPSGVERRLAEALALSASGPAGARRLVSSSAGTAKSKASSVAPTAATRLTGRRGQVVAGDSERIHEPGIERAPHRVRRGGGLAAAAAREEASGALPIGLGKVLAPEVMLSGLRSGELVKAMETVASRQATRGWDAVGVLTTLSDAGVDLGASRSSLPEGVSELVARARAATRGADVARADGTVVSPRLQAMVRDASKLGGSTQRALLEVLSGGDAGQAIARAGLGKKERAGLLSAVLRGTERAERSSLLEQAGGSDFAFAWLARVDGTRSGLDIGLGDTRAEFGRTFGRRRESALAGASPVQGASLVAPKAASQGEDKSGLRAVAAQFVHTSTGAARPQHGASDAMRRTDWRFVETGSRASTGHADLGKLAAAIVGSSETARRAPMPLVAPAAKAVAQTALRKDRRESVASGRGGRGGRGGGGGRPAEAKLSEQAIESLAIEMATRVARLMGLMKERIGVW
ncbi:MAG: hypothetical protein IT385_15230 [Deltaproteobacteria bacterium]|nr:hypothetical protein [Deltaproteobacteria bacterium]